MANNTVTDAAYIDAIAEANRRMLELLQRMDDLIFAIIFTAGLFIGLFVLKGMA